MDVTRPGSCATSPTTTPQTTSCRWLWLDRNRTLVQIFMWGHDHDGVHKQLPLREPEHLLITTEGPTLWSHNVLLGQQPVYGDATDSETAWWPRPRSSCCGSSEIAVEAESGFTGFEDLNGALGHNMKPSKQQPPATEQRIQAVIITSDQQYTRVKPCPKKVHKMTQEIGQRIKNDSLSQDLARRVAGQCNFLTGGLFGRAGPAPLKALYARDTASTKQLQQRFTPSPTS